MQFVALPQDRWHRFGTVPWMVASGTAFQTWLVQMSDTGEPDAVVTQAWGAPQDSLRARLRDDDEVQYQAAEAVARSPSPDAP
jgi:hypothetical protein